MDCSQCQTPNSDSARFCNNCGATLAVTQSADVVKVLTSSDENAGTIEAEKKDKLIGHTIEGRYRIESLIGLGGMGSVYRVTRLLIGDEVAMKILHTERLADPHVGERFRREAQAAARLKHPNAVSIYDFGITSDGLQYLVMELLEGLSLRQIIKQEAPLTPSVVVEITAHVCAALDEAHQRHIVHRDIKPDNIIINSTTAGLRVKVLDFGIAKLRDDVASHLTQTGSVMGTPHYMSPEQCLGEELDSRADIYSMGIVLYEMLCGRVPFDSPVSTAVVVQHVNQPPQSLRTINPGISPQVEAVVFHALEKLRDARPPTAGALARELTAAVHPTSAQAHSRSPQMSGPLQPPAEVTNETIIRRAARTPAATEMPTTVHLPAAQASGPTPSVRSTVPGGALRATATNQRLRMTIGATVFGVVLLGAVVALIAWTLTRERKQRPNQEPIGTANVQQTPKPSTTNNRIGMQFLLIPVGAFLMGSSEAGVDVAFADAKRTNSGAKREWFNGETPQHQVTIKEGFYIGKFEVTQSQWRALMGNNPSHFRDCASCPVEQVSWYDAQEFIRKLNEMSDGYIYSLPSEAEWEYACRAGTTMAFAFGDSLSSSQVNFNGEHPYGNAPEGAWVKKTTPVGSYQPNAWGLYDMHGNVYEWVEDIWADSYNGLSVDGSANANNGDPRYRVLRGGSWTNHAKYCRSAYRNRVAPDYRSLDSGFRVVAVPSK